MRIERVTASMSGPTSGNPGEGAGFAFFNAQSLEVLDSVSEQNEIGWFFADFTMSPGDFAAAIGALRIPLPETFGRAAARAAPAAKGTLLPQRITIETSRTLGNSQASMSASLRAGGRLRVSCSDFVGNGPSGLELLTPNIVNARANHWGDASGPTHPNNPAGTGDLVFDSAVGTSGTVLWDPLLTAPATPDDGPIPAEEIPATSPFGLAVLALLLGAAAVAGLQRRGGADCRQV